MKTRSKRLHEKGAVAVIERYWQAADDWQVPKRSYSRQRASDSLDCLLPVFIVHDPTAELPALLNTSTNVELNVTGSRVMAIPARNVLGWVEGTDRQLKNQFIVLSAHYDHIGVGPVPKMEEGKLDSIFKRRQGQCHRSGGGYQCGKVFCSPSCETINIIYCFYG